MLKHIPFFILLLFSMYGFAQNHTDEQGLKQGKWSKKHDNGNLRYEGQFSDDKEIGEFKFYDKYGKLVSERIYESPGGIALCKMYNMFGVLHAQGKMDGRKKEGEWVFYSSKGQDTVTVENYKNGVLEGQHITYFSNRKIASKVNFKDGKKVGKYTEYYKNGQLEQSGEYINGELHGEVTYWYNTGKLKRKGSFNNGDKIGKWTIYTPDGQVKQIIDYSKKK